MFEVYQRRLILVPPRRSRADLYHGSRQCSRLSSPFRMSQIAVARCLQVRYQLRVAVTSISCQTSSSTVSARVAVSSSSLPAVVKYGICIALPCLHVRCLVYSSTVSASRCRVSVRCLVFKFDLPWSPYLRNVRMHGICFAFPCVDFSLSGVFCRFLPWQPSVRALSSPIPVCFRVRWLASSSTVSASRCLPLQAPARRLQVRYLPRVVVSSSCCHEDLAMTVLCLHV